MRKKVIAVDIYIKINKKAFYPECGGDDFDPFMSYELILKSKIREKPDKSNRVKSYTPRGKRRKISATTEGIWRRKKLLEKNNKRRAEGR